MTEQTQGPLPGFVPWPVAVAARYRELGLWRGQTIGDWFNSNARQHGPRSAVVDGERRISYAQLAVLIDNCAKNLLTQGVQPSARVVVQLPNSLELVVVLLALSRAGAIAVLALPQHRLLELRAFVERAKASHVVLATSLTGSAAQALGLELLRHSSTLQGFFVHTGPTQVSAVLADPRFRPLASLFESSPNVALPSVAAADVALLQLSGGSTGVPKLIARTHDDYLYSVRQSASLCGLGEGSRYLAVLPMTHNFTLSSPGLLGVLDAGGTIVNCPNPNPNTVFGLLRAEKITITAAVPSLVLAWVEAIERRPDLRLAGATSFLLQVGGAKLSPDLAERALGHLGCELQQVFGMAEGLVNYTRLDASRETRLHTQGKPMSEFDELRVVDPEVPEGPALPIGATGELQTRGPYTIRGYYDNPDANAQSFTRDGFYRTFDLVRLTDTGDVVVEGRIGDRILRGGEKVSPDEVELILRRHPLVLDVAVVGIPDAVLGQRSCAFIVPRNDNKLPLSEVRAFLRNAGLAEFKFPDLLELCNELPRTAVGKTDRSALRRMQTQSTSLVTPPPFTEPGT
jgi:2,3-dihydroxybenzoate-AMP ligase